MQATHHAYKAVLSGLIALGIGAFSLPGAAYTPPAELTVVTDFNYPPYYFITEDGSPRGITIDKWALWSKHNGIPVRVLGKEWTQAQRDILNGTNDIIDPFGYNEARAQLYDYSKSGEPLEARVYFHKSISGINDAASMRGFTLGAQAGSACAKWLEVSGIKTIREYADSEAVVKAAIAGEVRLFCLDTQNAQYFLFKNGVADDFRQSAALYSSHIHWAVKKGRGDLRDFVEAGYARISSQELEEINARWLGTALSQPFNRQFFAYAGVLAASGLGLTLVLLGWNASLQKRVAARTLDLNAALQAEKISSEKVQDLYNRAPCGYHSLDMSGVFIEINETELRWLGYQREEVVGKRKFRDFMTPASQRLYDENFLRFKELGGLSDLEYDLVRKNGSVFSILLAATMARDKDGAGTMTRATLYDITERKKAEEKIHTLAFYDQLTGLPNRLLLLDRLRQTMATCARRGSVGALLFIDLDNFKMLNDTLGHDVGDALLVQVAQRLLKCVRESDTVARFGGDEFAVVLTELDAGHGGAENVIRVVVDKILSALNQPYQLNGVSHHSTASIGVTLLGRSQFTADDLMKQADLAMYKSKSSGRDAWHFFEPQMEATLKQRAALEGEIRQGIDQLEFFLCYQPQVADSHRITGAEALVRWQHPVRGLVSPAEFIPVTEETGLILPLGQKILEAACIQLARWGQRPQTAHFTMAVNVSATQLNHFQFVEDVLAILKSTGANPQRLKLELTETALLTNLETIIEKMFALKEVGVGFSLDDFGTGYSSLLYLKRLPLDQLKIDQSFVRDILTDPNDAVIARTIVVLAQSLGLNVIAEGVETQAHRDFLYGVGCTAYQGYYFSRPVPIADFEKLVLQQAA